MAPVLSFLFKRDAQRNLPERPLVSTDYLGLKTLYLPPEKDEESEGISVEYGHGDFSAIMLTLP